MKKDELRRKHMKKRKSIYVMTHAPFVMTGKYNDYNDGVIVCSNILEYTYESLASSYRKKEVVLYLNSDEPITFKVKKLDYNQKEDYGTIKCLVYGILKKLKDRGYLDDFKGFIFSAKTNISTGEGNETNFMINFLKSLSLIYELDLSDLTICKIAQEVYKEYFGKILPLVHFVAYFQNGITHLQVKEGAIACDVLEERLDKYQYVNFIDGKPLTLKQNNGYFKSLFDVYNHAKKYLATKSLLDVDFSYLFPFIFGQTSKLQDYEKLTLTHYSEEIKRSKTLFEGLKDLDYHGKVYDAINMSHMEMGSFLSLNNFNNYLEVTAFKAPLKTRACVTPLNVEASNNFIFIVDKGDANKLIHELYRYKHFVMEKVHLAPKGIIIERR